MSKDFSGQRSFCFVQENGNVKVLTGGSWNFCRATTGSFEAAAFVSRSLKGRQSVSMKRLFLFAAVNCGLGK
jgi:hypothetical protein